jgi:ketosteroid isomerase-like protein
MDNEQVVRKLYELAEVNDYPGFVACFTEDGTFTDMSLGVTYRGPEELPTPGVVMAAAFPDMHRELYDLYLSGDDMVVVQLALQGTHEGPLEYPFGTIPATGKRMDAPCCDVFQLVDGKIQRFDCYPSGTVILSQLGVLTDLEAVLTH